MTRLVTNAFDRRYAELVELGRSLLPSLAPDWTDYNAHDPGITLMELMAWVTEAQLYSAGHVRRDERLAYGALMGVQPEGTRPARGLLWSDPGDPSSPFVRYVGTRIIEPDAQVLIDAHDTPRFHPARRVLWAPGDIVALRARLSDGSMRDLRSANDRRMAFLPFGEAAGPHDMLELGFRTHADQGLFPPRREDAKGACWTLGIRADTATLPADHPPGESAHPCATGSSEISIALVSDGASHALPVVEDTTAGLLRTGVLMLDVSQVPDSPQSFVLQIRSRRGFVRPPRWLHVEPNVLPITQRVQIEDELHVANGTPDFAFDLDVPGLCFERGTEPLEVTVAGDAGFESWRRCDFLEAAAPTQSVFELDANRERLRFGNGINGRRPAPDSQVYVSYAVSEGAAGNVARNRKWRVAGFTGIFGTNPDAIDGGADATGLADLRRVARQRIESDHALVTAADIVAAALGLPLLEVARAWVAVPSGDVPANATITLVAMRRRTAAGEASPAPETARWLQAVQRALAPRIPLGTRLRVVAPRYTEVRVRTSVVVARGRDPLDVQQRIADELRSRLALVRSPGAADPREAGLPLSRRDVVAWVLGVSGVERLTQLQLIVAGKADTEARMSARGLPRLVLHDGDISATRADSGGAP